MTLLSDVKTLEDCTKFLWPSQKSWTLQSGLHFLKVNFTNKNLKSLHKARSWKIFLKVVRFWFHFVQYTYLGSKDYFDQVSPTYSYILDIYILHPKAGRPMKITTRVEHCVDWHLAFCPKIVATVRRQALRLGQKIWICSKLSCRNDCLWLYVYLKKFCYHF